MNKTRIDFNGGSRSATTVTKLELFQTEARGYVTLAPGEKFGNYVIGEQMRVVSAEADLWLVTGESDGRRFVMKLYRHGCTLRHDVAESVRKLSHAHVVEIVEYGRVGERDFEVQEFVPHGSLADLLRNGPLPEVRAREVVGEILGILREVHRANLLHRDIKPSNLLVRNLDPLDLVISDFGISSRIELALHVTSLQRTVAYAAPEALTGVIGRATDWWSVGVLLVEALAGTHPFAQMTEQVVNLQLVSRPFPIPDSIKGRWRTLIRGLLLRDHAQRWGEVQVQAWLDGDDSIEVPEEGMVSHASVPYKFEGTDCYSPRELGVALAESWSEAIKRFVNRSSIQEWVERDIGDADLANRLQDIREDGKLTSNQKLSVALMAMAPDLPLVWDATIVSREWLQANPRDAVAIFESSVPSWEKKLRKDAPLAALADRRLVLWREILALSGLHTQNAVGFSSAQQIVEKSDRAAETVSFDSDLVEQLFLADIENVRSEARTIQQKMVMGRTNFHQAVLANKPLTDAAAILLCASHRQQYETKAQIHQRYIVNADKLLLNPITLVKCDLSQLLAEARLRELRAALKTLEDSASSDEFTEMMRKLASAIDQTEDAIRHRVRAIRRIRIAMAFTIVAFLAINVFLLFAVGHITVTTDRPSAEYTITGEGSTLRGAGEKMFNDVRTGKYTIQWNFDRWKLPPEPFAVKRGKATNLVKRFDGTIVINTNPNGASVSFNGPNGPIGYTPYRIDSAPPGEITVTFSKDGYYREAVKYSLQQSGTLTVDKDLDAIYKTITYNDRGFTFNKTLVSNRGRGGSEEKEAEKILKARGKRIVVEKDKITVEFEMENTSSDIAIFTYHEWGVTITDDLGKTFHRIGTTVSTEDASRFTENPSYNRLSDVRGLEVPGYERRTIGFIFSMITPGAWRIDFRSEITQCNDGFEWKQLQVFRQDQHLSR